MGVSINWGWGGQNFWQCRLLEGLLAPGPPCPRRANRRGPGGLPVQAACDQSWAPGGEAGGAR